MCVVLFELTILLIARVFLKLIQLLITSILGIVAGLQMRWILVSLSNS